MSQSSEAALANLLDHYLALVNSGDAGNWNPEEEPVVIEARRALANTFPVTCGEERQTTTSSTSAICFTTRPSCVSHITDTL